MAVFAPSALRARGRMSWRTSLADRGAKAVSVTACRWRSRSAERTASARARAQGLLAVAQQVARLDEGAPGAVDLVDAGGLETDRIPVAERARPRRDRGDRAGQAPAGDGGERDAEAEEEEAGAPQEQRLVAARGGDERDGRAEADRPAACPAPG